MSGGTDEDADGAGSAPHPRLGRTLIGHADHERVLLDAYRSGRLPHAIIIGGPQGIGKATLAWRLAKFVLTHPDPNSPVVAAAGDLDAGTSHAAAQVEAMAHPDVALLRREFNEKTKRLFTEIRADDVRRAIGLFQRAAGAGGYRICILDSAEDLNRSSANALLKLVEEPPPKSLFLIVAHRPGLILPTIRSRARLIRLAALAPEEVARIVASRGTPWSDMPSAEIEAAARHANGSVREALRHLEHRGTGIDAKAGRVLDRLPGIEWREVHALADAVAGRDGDLAYETLITVVFDWLATQVRAAASTGPKRLAPYAEVWEKVAQAARETDALNLDRRPLILSIMTDLAAAVRASTA